jgi:hypothetical protein
VEKEYMNAKLLIFETNSKNKNTGDFYMGISEFK